MSEPSCEFDPVDDLANAFLERYRRGERPSLSEYTDKYPELAERIRAVFPALVVLEQVGDGKSQGTGLDAVPFGSDARMAQRLGDFVLIRRVGAGGMGIVYEAEHESLKSRMALKVMHPRFRADRAYVRRFQNEARSAAKLHHTNIVSVFDYGEQDGVCYYAMQYIVGVGLERVLSHMAETGDAGAAALDACARDEVAGGLLLLHGLHPLDIEERVLLALEQVRPYLASHGGDVELLGIRDGMARLRLVGSCHGCPSSALTMKQTIEEAILGRAPDIVAVEVEGDTSAPLTTPDGRPLVVLSVS